MIPGDSSDQYVRNFRRATASVATARVSVRNVELPSGGHGLNGYQGPMWDKWQAEALKWMKSQRLVR